MPLLEANLSHFHRTEKLSQIEGNMGRKYKRQRWSKVMRINVHKLSSK